ncbi:MAG: hypothetical protein QM820_51645 [Minicystis sp.]
MTHLAETTPQSCGPVDLLAQIDGARGGERIHLRHVEARVAEVRHLVDDAVAVLVLGRDAVGSGHLDGVGVHVGIAVVAVALVGGEAVLVDVVVGPARRADDPALVPAVAEARVDAEIAAAAAHDR